MFKFWFAVVSVATVSATRLCCLTAECFGPSFDASSDCLTMRDLAFWWWCDGQGDCKEYGGTGQANNYCCGYDHSSDQVIAERCTEPSLYDMQECRNMQRMTTDPGYYAALTGRDPEDKDPSGFGPFRTLEEICFGTGGLDVFGFGNKICNENDNDGFAGGEPHFKTWAGEWYDYHGVCDLVLVNAPDAVGGLGLTVHIRTKARYDYSYIESAVVQIAGEHVMEVSSWGDYFINGVQNAGLPTLLGGTYVVTHRQPSDKEHRFIVKLDQEFDGEQLVLNVFKDMVSVKFDGVEEKSFGTSRGLLGTFGEGVLVGRNGTVFSVEDAISFAEDWQVLPGEPKLFQDSARFPQAPAMCTRPDPAAKAARRRLGETVHKEAAMAACSHWEHKDACVYDVMATGDLDLAKSTPY